MYNDGRRYRDFIWLEEKRISPVKVSAMTCFLNCIATAGRKCQSYQAIIGIVSRYGFAISRDKVVGS